jgi:hypothetical protein
MEFRLFLLQVSLVLSLLVISCIYQPLAEDADDPRKRFGVMMRIVR